MGSVSKPERVRALQTLGVWCHMELTGTEPPKAVLESLNFDSTEAMQIQLGNWGIPSWVLGDESETNSAPNKDRKKRPSRLRSFGPAKELPPAGNATELFKERLEALLKSAELLKHMNEGLHGRHFVRQDVDTATVDFSRDFLSKEWWDTFCEQRELDPDDKDLSEFWDTSALTVLPGGVALSPSETEAIFIGVYALAGGDMDLLLDALHSDSPSVKPETRERVRLWVEGAKANNERDGLKVLAHQLAIWVRGSEVRPGRPPGVSKAAHAFACRVTRYRKQGLTDEEIAHKESHRRKEDGSSYSVKDVTALGDLGLSWP